MTLRSFGLDSSIIIPSCEYIRILEPQQSGRWHIHLLVKSVIAPLYIQFKHLRKLWGYGRVRVERLPFATNYGAYFCARFDNKEDSSFLLLPFMWLNKKPVNTLFTGIEW